MIKHKAMKKDEKTPSPSSESKDKSTSKGNEAHSSSKDPKHKSLIDKVRGALQEWSNENEQEIEEDDDSPQTSGL